MNKDDMIKETKCLAVLNTVALEYLINVLLDEEKQIIIKDLIEKSSETIKKTTLKDLFEDRVFTKTTKEEEECKTQNTIMN